MVKLVPTSLLNSTLPAKLSFMHSAMMSVFMMLLFTSHCLGAQHWPSPLRQPRFPQTLVKSGVR